MAAAAGAGTHVFAIHPELGWPDEEWVTADRELWRARLRQAVILKCDRGRIPSDSRSGASAA